MTGACTGGLAASRGFLLLARPFPRRHPKSCPRSKTARETRPSPPLTPTLPPPPSSSSAAPGYRTSFLSTAPSLTLEIFLYFGKLWDVAFWVLSFLVMCWKGYNLPYPDDAYETEFALLFVYLLIEPARLFLGSKGNKTLTNGPLYASLVLAAYVLFMHVYYVAGQTFITRCDYAINSISLAFVCAQSFLALAQAVEVSRTR